MSDKRLRIIEVEANGVMTGLLALGMKPDNQKLWSKNNLSHTRSLPLRR